MINRKYPSTRLRRLRQSKTIRDLVAENTNIWLAAHLKELSLIHMINRKYPSTRLRRLRQSKTIRDLVAENTVSSNDLIEPMFLVNSKSDAGPVNSMPGVERFEKDQLFREIEESIKHGIKAFAIFPVVPSDLKDESGSYALSADNFLINFLREFSERYPDVISIADVALDPYTSHGHDGILANDIVLNDETNELLGKQAVLLADAGASIVAPSDMMDGRIGVIRSALDANKNKDTIILSYAAKFASSFYGPFRDAVGSKTNLAGASKKTYQMDVRNSDEALHEVAIDVDEGADIVMIKPGMPYLDIISKVKEKFQMPTFAYQVSGEYSMLSNAISQGLLDKSVMLESIVSFKRAGSDAVLTYAAKQIAKEIKDE